MSTNKFLPVFPLPDNAVQLGWLTLNMEYPYQDYEEIRAVKQSDVIVGEKKNLLHLRNQSQDVEIQAAVSRLLTAAYGSDDSKTLKLHSPVAMTYLLKNSGAWFYDICAVKKTRQWIESAIRRGRNIYLISGYYTLCDAKVDSTSTHGSSVSGSFQVPVAELATGVPSLLGDALDVGLRAQASKRLTDSQHFIAPGDQIFAVQYRLVKFGWFSSRRVEMAYLESNNRWRGLWRTSTEWESELNDEEDKDGDEDEENENDETEKSHDDKDGDEDDCIQVDLVDDSRKLDLLDDAPTAAGGS